MDPQSSPRFPERISHSLSSAHISSYVLTNTRNHSNRQQVLAVFSKDGLFPLNSKKDVQVVFSPNIHQCIHILATWWTYFIWLPLFSTYRPTRCFLVYLMAWQPEERTRNAAENTLFYVLFDILKVICIPRDTAHAKEQSVFLLTFYLSKCMYLSLYQALKWTRNWGKQRCSNFLFPHDCVHSWTHIFWVIVHHVFFF